MQTVSISGASAPPIHPAALQAARIAARFSVSPAVAGVLAGHAFGADRRDHDALLFAVVGDRCASARRL